MTLNMGTADRIVRVAAGIVLLSLLVLVEGNARWWGLLGLIPLATGLMAWCPLYVALGFTTRGDRVR